MNVARILYPVKVLGPGERIGIWLCGCPHRCKGCSNPELWEYSEMYEASTDFIYKLISSIAGKYQVDGFTISGGEPFAQPEELSVLVNQIKSISDDILVYSGYTLEELRGSGRPSISALLSSVAVLIDGRYKEEQNDNSFLRGSGNQTIHILNDKYLSYYDDYCQNNHNRIQNFKAVDGIISVGIHKPGFSNSDKEAT